MDAMILAAGLGSRLAELGQPKPLVEVAGRTLISWSVAQASRAGIGRFVVVTGYCGAEVEQHLERVAHQLDVTIEPVRLDDWSRPNGHSVLAGAARMSGSYLLMMADHLFSAGLLARVLQSGPLSSGALLAIDRNVAGPRIDPDDATFVTLDQAQRITAIGKHIAPRDAVDCGAFIATPDLAGAIEAAIADGATGTLSDGMQRLAVLGLAGTLDVTGEWWIDVDDPAMHALAEAEAPLCLGHLEPDGMGRAA